MCINWDELYVGAGGCNQLIMRSHGMMIIVKSDVVLPGAPAVVWLLLSVVMDDVIAYEMNGIDLSKCYDVINDIIGGVVKWLL